MGNDTTKKPKKKTTKKKTTKKKVIKVGVGKPYLRGGKPFTSPDGATDRTGKLKTTLNSIEVFGKMAKDKKITHKELKKAINNVLEVARTQMKNNTYGKSYMKKKK